jgi:hypothetical protein
MDNGITTNIDQISYPVDWTEVEGGGASLNYPFPSFTSLSILHHAPNSPRILEGYQR